jgi:hypothetical protein
MDLAQLVVYGIVGLCAFIGMFVRARTVAIACAVLAGLAAVGIAYGYGTGNETLGFMFGVAMMAISFMGVIAVAGGAMLRSILKK